MSKSVLRRVHVTASVLAIFTVTTFLAATLTAEISGDEASITMVKSWIARAVVGLTVVLASAALSGRRLAGRSRAPVVRRKLRRMQAIAATGMLILIPCAVALDQLASRGNFGTTFLVLQGIELAAGGVNLTLLGLNFRDGVMLGRQGRRRAAVVRAKEHR
ncbi:MAG TPA: hypothetical protein DGT23_26295 [Micromonosporaceae bacterium]|nr:hypothetical protein [Micromonosporaceae bacterium]